MPCVPRRIRCERTFRLLSNVSHIVVSCESANCWLIRHHRVVVVGRCGLLVAAADLRYGAVDAITRRCAAELLSQRRVLFTFIRWPHNIAARSVVKYSCELFTRPSVQPAIALMSDWSEVSFGAGWYHGGQ